MENKLNVDAIIDIARNLGLQDRCRELEFLKSRLDSPNKDLIINFSIIFRGIMNILPIKKITIIPAKYAIKVFESKLNHLTTINIMF